MKCYLGVSLVLAKNAFNLYLQQAYRPYQAFEQCYAALTQQQHRCHHPSSWGNVCDSVGGYHFLLKSNGPFAEFVKPHFLIVCNFANVIS